MQPEILNSGPDEPFHNVWTGIAEGNLGRNMFLRGHYDQAIPLFKSSFEKMVKEGEYGFAIEVATDLAKIYLDSGNMAEAKYLAFWAKEHDTGWRFGASSRIYETLSKYYALTGNVKLSMAYVDSLLLENKKEEQQFSAIQMLRAEQKQNIAEQKLKEEQLNAEKLKKERYKRSLTISVLVVLLFGGGLMRYYVLFRKKKAAYRELARKSQVWANVFSPDETGHEKQDMMSDETGKQHATSDETGHRKLNTTSDETRQELHDTTRDGTDLQIMNKIEKTMQKDKLYKESELSIDSLSHILEEKNINISRAISRCTNKSFRTFINEYRIKEAIRILSNDNANKFTIDAVAFEVGFTDRWNFYRVFKKMTGLSPTEFKKNLEGVR
jgi:AraC-like DNA-binding protein